MGIWIRSQDNRELINVKHVLVRGKSIGVAVNGRVISMGEYETEERVLEVFNEIQRHITMLGHNQMYSSNPDEQYSYEVYIFEMPEK